MIKSGWHHEWDAYLAALPARRRMDALAVRLAPLADLARAGVSMREAADNMARSFQALSRASRRQAL